MHRPSRQVAGALHLVDLELVGLLVVAMLVRRGSLRMMGGVMGRRLGALSKMVKESDAGRGSMVIGYGKGFSMGMEAFCMSRCMMGILTVI